MTISRTFVAATGRVPPLQLTPQWTTLALLQPGMDAGWPTFHLSSVLPDNITLAGTFAPAQGTVTLSGRRQMPRLHAKGQYLGSSGWSEWELSGIRAPWFGEFFETKAGA